MNENWLQRRLSNGSSRQQDHRSPFQRDRARILHSAAFRRLQAKTQVMGIGQSDFYRTRLTHSLEAAQIGSGITAQLRSKFPEQCSLLLPNEDSLIEAICLAHDIGHPPFGHGGEVALNYMMHNFGGFEGNGQTFRIVTKLEPYTEHFGMNLSRRTLLGLLKYPQIIDKLANHQIPATPVNFRQLKASDWHPPKGLYIDDIELLNWVLEPLSEDDKAQFQKISVNASKHHKTQFKSFDCSIMELADDIAYGIHDMEDAIVTGVVNKDSFVEHVIKPLEQLNDSWLNQIASELADKLFSKQHHKQKDGIGSLVNYLITAIELIDLNKVKGTSFVEPLLRYNAALPETEAAALAVFKDYVYQFVIKQTNIQRMEYKGQQIVMELFEAFASDPQRLLPDATCQRWLDACENSQNPQRVIADYLSGMTDEFATKIYNSMFLASGINVNEDNY
ncbi:anti-phage deoxyguanosine triphosphatase [Thalassotalea fonticola]|uniref:Deoxyguanosinetriphosphate triphosphohydrolase-like protein n=1 Tax=Thalassotalea fonticola TaxID=3065649 RepID=A0ABZ0GRY3_9GAMM|nr:anti-phage deoxyguanosine triphosphatase [Colwelliaceae bacterium S1-1]